MTDRQLWWYEHGFLRQLHPQATDAEIGRMMDRLRAELVRYETRNLGATDLVLRNRLAGRDFDLS